MTKIKYFVFTDPKDSNELTIIMEDGAIGSTYVPNKHIVSEMYQNRITPDTTTETVWDELETSKLYCYDWDGKEGHKFKENVDEEIIQHIIKWLCFGSKDVEYEKVDAGEFNDENLNKVKQQIQFENE